MRRRRLLKEESRGVWPGELIPTWPRFRPYQYPGRNARSFPISIGVLVRKMRGEEHGLDLPWWSIPSTLTVAHNPKRRSWDCSSLEKDPRRDQNCTHFLTTMLPYKKCIMAPQTFADVIPHSAKKIMSDSRRRKFPPGAAVLTATCVVCSPSLSRCIRAACIPRPGFHT